MYFGIEAGIGSNRNCKEQESFGKAIRKGAMFMGAGAALAIGGKGAYGLAKKAYSDDMKQAITGGLSSAKDSFKEKAAVAIQKGKQYVTKSAGDAVGGTNIINP